mmetsp:Transcript_43309/g.41708  ORF Transcript_43309/g.41708 Transcript_43309/m.41708 type:complete len:104 (+) Transcript_43309:1647-1958(+)
MLLSKNAFEANLRVYGHCDNATHVYDVKTNEFENLENANFVTVTKPDGSKQRLDVLFAYDSSVSHNKIQTTVMVRNQDRESHLLELSTNEDFSFSVEETLISK